MKITKSELRLFANPKAVIAQFLHLSGNGRVEAIIKRVANLQEKEVALLFRRLMADFGARHRDITGIFARHFDKINPGTGNLSGSFSQERKLLLGAFFTKEYSIQSAALFNPSIVSHPDQENLQAGEQRFVLSLRATGEGHISSIAFQTGVINDAGELKLDLPPLFFTPLQQNELAGSDYDVASPGHVPLNEKVIFPHAKAESMGMEDVRFVRFTDNGHITYYGTYTAYDGQHIKSQLIETDDFNAFKIRSLYGAAVSDKGMALFPEKVNGKYVMISRQGGEKINIMFSDSIYLWEEYTALLEPQFDWELVQLGNCGSPIRTGKGWLLLTHGVGVMRTYVISALLLDLDDPSKIIARLERPLLAADAAEREGYVPNVVYTCGLLQHKKWLLIPYAVSDSAIGFATMALDDLLNEMKLL